MSVRISSGSPVGRGEVCPPGRNIARLIALFALAGFIASYPLAYASGPDEIWRPGLYDGADADDLIGLLVDAGMLIDSATGRIGLLRSIAGPVPARRGSLPSSIALATLHLRSPPAS